MSSTPVVLPAKRKRGRPRKDGNAAKKGEEGQQPPATPDGIRAVQQIETKLNDRSMVGRVVSGVIDGSFDAGYFLSVRIGNNSPPLPGVIFESGRIMPISSDNDVARHAKLYQRTEMPMAAPNPQDHGNGIGPQLDMQPPSISNEVLHSMQQSNASYMFHNQSASTSVRVMNTTMNNSSSSLVEKFVIQQKPNLDYRTKCQSIPSAKKLRMVEQDETMQAYEVLIQSEGLMEDAGSAKDWMSESSIRLSASNVLPHKEFMDQVLQYQNQDMVFCPEPSAPVRDEHNRLDLDMENLMAIEPRSVAQETQTINSEVKQNQLACNKLNDPYHVFQHSSVVAQVQPLPGESPVIDSGFQPREVVQNESQIKNLDLHETPIVAQTPSVTLENQNLESALQTSELIDTQIHGPNPQSQFLHQDQQAVEPEIKTSERIENQPTRPNPELYQTPRVEKLQTVCTNPEGREAELEPSKLAQYDLENQNFGILRDFVAGNHHYRPPEVICDQPRDFMVEKPNCPKRNSAKDTQVEPKSTGLGNNESILSGKPISDPVDSNQKLKD